MGYAIVDDSQARLWTAFQASGGVDRLGFPASQRFHWGGFVTQVTQKAVLQWRPEKGSIDFVNVFDDLTNVGKNDWLATVRAVPAPVPSDYDKGLSWDQTIQHRLTLLASRPVLAARYQSTANPIDLFGLPVSPVVDAGPMYVIRLQRAVLQEWKVKEPWANAGEVTIANGGDVAKEAGVFPERSLRPVPPPGGAIPGQPSDYQLSGHATWYGPGFVGKPMADGLTYQPSDPTTTAANAFPLGSTLQVTAPSTGKTIRVVVRDTGAFPYPDVVDLSPAAFQSLGVPTATGVVSVTVTMVSVALPVTSNTQAPPSEKTARN